MFDFLNKKTMAKTTYTETNVNSSANEHNDLQLELMTCTDEDRKSEIIKKQQELHKSRLEARKDAESKKSDR